MHFRLQLWVAFFAFFAVTAVRAQAPATASSSGMPPGQIKAVKVEGAVSVILNGQTTALHENDFVPQSGTVITQGKSSVILVFSNGATTQLGSDTTLVIDEFLQDPFPQEVAVATLTAEPTVSHTHLHLNKGELIGNVKHLNKDHGSTFTIDTPVGAAGIRGTTFRIIFRPSGTGQAFAIFSVSTLEGNVVFQSAQAQQQAQQQAQNQQAAKETRARGGSVAVTTGQEVVVTVSVETDPKTGQVVVTAPVQLATTTPLNPVVRASIISEATNMATTVEQKGTTFSSSGTSSGGTSSGSSSSSSSSTSTDSTKKDDTSSSDSSGGTSGGTSSGGTSTGGSSTNTSSTSGPTSSGPANTGAASTLTSSIAGGRQINTSPGFTIGGTQNLTPGAGGNP